MANQITKLQTDHKTLKDMVMRLTASLSTEGSVSTGNVAQPPRAPTEPSRLVESAIVDSDSKAIISKRLNQLEIFSPGTLIAGTLVATVSMYAYMYVHKSVSQSISKYYNQ